MRKLNTSYTSSLYAKNLEIFCRIPRLLLDVVWATILQDEHHPESFSSFSRIRPPPPQRSKREQREERERGRPLDDLQQYNMNCYVFQGLPFPPFYISFPTENYGKSFIKN